MKIKSVRTYQSVTFEKQVQTFFTIEKLPNRPHDLVISVDKDLMAIHLKTAKDEVYIPFTNVISFNIWNEEDDAKEEAKNVKVVPSLKSHEIKRPK